MGNEAGGVDNESDSRLYGKGEMNTSFVRGKARDYGGILSGYFFRIVCLRPNSPENEI